MADLPSDFSQLLDRLSFSPPPVHLVGLTVPDSSNPFFSSLSFKLGNELSKMGLHLMVACSERRSSFDLKLVGDFARVGARCVLLCASDDLTQERADFVHDLSVPVIQLDRFNQLLRAPFVGFDNKAGGEIAARHAIDKGHRRVAVIPGPQRIQTVDDRVKSFAATVEAAGIDCLVLEAGDLSFRSGYEIGMGSLRELVRDARTSLFCANDCMAIGVLRAASDLGISVPNELGVVGYDAIAVSEWTTPRLTTIEQPLDDLASAAASIVESVMKQPSGQVEQYKAVLPKLLDRGSN